MVVYFNILGFFLEFKWYRWRPYNLRVKYMRWMMHHRRRQLLRMHRHKWHHLALWWPYKRNILIERMRTHVEKEGHHVLRMLLAHSTEIECHHIAHFFFIFPRIVIFLMIILLMLHLSLFAATFFILFVFLINKL